MKIAILAWGSLIWDKRELKIEPKWYTGGVELPIEFSRISKDGRLTLVVDEKNGTMIETYWAISTSLNLNDAIVNLKRREGTIDKRIGFVDLENDRNNSHLSPDIIDKISNWAKDNDLSAVLWTDLPSNFLEKRGIEFSIENATNYLESLKEKTKELADKYIIESPPQTMTYLKKQLNDASA